MWGWTYVIMCKISWQSVKPLSRYGDTSIFQGCGGRHLEKSKNRDISASFWPISTKFGIPTHSVLFSRPTVKNLKFEKSKMAAAAILKNRKIAISRPRFAGFRPNLARRRSSALFSRPTVKKLKFEKSKMAAAAILKKSKNRHISAAFWPISTKFGKATQFGPLQPSDR